MTKFTPKPWSIPHFARDEVKCDCASILAEGYMGAIAEVHFDNGLRIGNGGNDCPPIEEAKANARLMAAAPELLEALQDAREQFAALVKVIPVLQCKVDEYGAAIAKALGEGE
jgi:hypothetical protein